MGFRIFQAFVASAGIICWFAMTVPGGRGDPIRLVSLFADRERDQMFEEHLRAHIIF